MRIRLAVPVVALAAVALIPADVTGQVRASERAMVSQTVDGTVITLEYSRPQAKGRAPLLGDVVRWDRPWTGANEATVLELNNDVTIEGVDVPAGRWSLWLVPSEDGPWEMFLDPRDELWHTARPGPTDDQIRFPVEGSVDGDHVEALTWTFPRVAPDGATMTLAWGAMRVPVDVEVEPSLETTVAAEHARPYVGSWSLRWQLTGEPEPPVPFDVSYDDAARELRVETVYPTPEGDRVEAELLLTRRAEGIFVPIILQDGEFFDTAAYLFFEFEFEDEQPTSFLVRWAADDSVIGTGERAGS
ncbi:MAG: DUF2911 domain-containing protein [Gemmatimonadota bacterium]